MATSTVLSDAELKAHLGPRAAFDDLLKRRFFFGPSFEIYGGSAGLIDLGPAGCSLKTHLESEWRQHYIIHEEMLEVQCTTLTPEPVFKASGHVAKFSDHLVKDVANGDCYRADVLLQDFLTRELEKDNLTQAKRDEYQCLHTVADTLTVDELGEAIHRLRIRAPQTGNELSDPYPFNLMFGTSIGPSGQMPGYLRPETAQGIFTNFKRLLEYNGGRLPFAAATIGAAYRNEISPRGLFRLREFHMAEIEHFCPEFTDPELNRLQPHPKWATVKDLELQFWSREAQLANGPMEAMTLEAAMERGLINNQTIAYFIGRTARFLVDRCGLKAPLVRFRQHLMKQMAHYASDCWDAEVFCSQGWLECVGIADRTCFDLTQHMRATGVELLAREMLENPITVEAFRAIPVKGPLGRGFRGGMKAVAAHLEGLGEEEARTLAQAMQDNGKATVLVSFPNESEPRECELLPPMVQFKTVTDKVSVRKYTPMVVEPSFGISRIMLVILEHAFYVRPDSDTKGLVRGVFALRPALAPVKCSVLPLLQDDRFQPICALLATDLANQGLSFKLDSSGVAIGRRYARTDEIGIPFAITVDHDSVSEDTVTLRERDTMAQIRVPVREVATVVKSIVSGLSSWEAVRSQYPAFIAGSPSAESTKSATE